MLGLFAQAFASLFDHFVYYGGDGAAAGASDAGDDSDRGEVDAGLFAVGFSLLAGGSKGGKIWCGFELLDSDGDGALTAQEFIRLMQVRVVPMRVAQLNPILRCLEKCVAIGIHHRDLGLWAV